MGRTLAHEFCHSVTLGPFHQYTGNDSSTGHANETGHVEPSDTPYLGGFEQENPKHNCNLMRKTRPKDCPPEIGYLTDQQKHEIRTYIKNNGIGEEKTGENRKIKNKYKRTPPKDKKDFKNDYKK